MTTRRLKLRLHHAMQHGEPFYVSTTEWQAMKRAAPPTSIWGGGIGTFSGVKVVVNDLLAAAHDILIWAYWESS